MRKWSSQLVLVLLAATSCLGQQASVNVSARAGLPYDQRPFGKYLVETCTFGGEHLTLSCTKVAYPADSLEQPKKPCQKPHGEPCRTNAILQLKDQSVTIKLVCDPAKKAPCDPTNPKLGSDFYVSATADSGLPVQQRVLVGNATPLGGYHTVHYRANGVGPIVIRGIADEQKCGQPPVYDQACGYNAAPPVDLILQVSAEAASKSDSCPVLPPSAGSQSKPLDAPTIVSLMGNPTPFVVAPEGSNTIFIYATRLPLQRDEPSILGSFQQAIAALAGRTAASLGITPTSTKSFTVELNIPHASALGDLGTRIGGLNFSQFTLQDVGRNRVRVTAPTQPDCDTWKGFLSDIREMAWQLVADPMSYKLYYLSSSDVATAFSGLAPAATTTSTTTPAATAAPTATTPPGASSTPATATTATPSTASPSPTIAITQPPGSNIQITSDTTPCVVAGLAFGNATGCGSAPAAAATPAAVAAAATPVAPAPLAMASVAVAAGTGEQTPPDLLLYSDTNPGDDAQIEERNRILAQLDLPRPEMILTAWVTQNSSASPQAIGAFNNMIKGLVADYDHEFEQVVLTGWGSVKNQSAKPGYFNEPFRSYIEDRFVADTSQDTKPGSSPQQLAQAFLDHSQATMADPVSPMKRTDLGICERGRYCLGYNSLFDPLKPALTDLLLTIVAAQKPAAVADSAVAEVEGTSGFAMDEGICGDERQSEARKRCRAIWSNLNIDLASPPPQQSSCEVQDFQGILASLMTAPYEPRVHLQCFKQQAELLLGPASVGLLRAAIADFLFNYKMSQHYPHEFVPYDLTQSANALNNALSPLIDAFNRDLWSYQMFVRADMQYRVEQLNSRMDNRCCVKRLFGLDKPSFFNDGLVTVRTISGQATSVSTTSQSFLNGSTAPELANVLSSIAGAAPAAASPALAPASTGTTTTTTTTTTGGAAAASGGGGAPPSTLGAISNILANYQTTYVQIGRQLSFSATPRSLATASSAEIAVTLNADESAGGPLYTGANASDPAFNTSRVANHDTTTRVRVDSIKLFEVSSFSAIVERSRSRFPLLPPFVEIPYIGTFAGIPLGAAKEFHSSTAIISAYVVPTAADIAYGLRFVSDLVVDGFNSGGSCSFYKGAAGPDVSNTCVFRKMLSLLDVGVQQPIAQFNKEITRCFATDTSLDGCKRVSFDNTLESR
jgi:hypothetical protein